MTVAAAAYRLSVEDARRFGSRSTGGSLPVQLDPPVYSEVYFKAFFGDGTGERVVIEDEEGRVVEVVMRGGCRGIAERVLFENLSDCFSLRPILENARNESIARVESSSVWYEHMVVWSRCMVSRGFEFGDVSSLRESLVYDDNGPSEVEIVVAVADAECRERHGTDQLFVDLLWGTQEEWIEQNTEFLDSYNRMRQSASDTAEDLLSR